MTTAPPVETSFPASSTATFPTLRARLEHNRATAHRFHIHEAAALLTPLATGLAEAHDAGYRLFVHPSSLVTGPDGSLTLASTATTRPPVLPADQACLAPESRGSVPEDAVPGDARSSVFSVGAIAYEMLTGRTVGPNMRSPRDILPHLPAELDGVLSMALVEDPGARPDDLRALAQALEHVAATTTDDDDVDVDVSLSMMPPAPGVVQATSPYDIAVRSTTDDETTKLAGLKAKLESDPTPRYVVHKDGMDHGPFNAVELLQQIASHSFHEADLLRDSVNKQEMPIGDWSEFAPFAQHARLHRNIAAEREAVHRVVAQERKRTTGKALLGVLAVGAVLAGAIGWFVAVNGSRSDEQQVHAEEVTNIETDAGLAVRRHDRGGRGGPVSGNFPQLSGGTSCEAAQAAYREVYDLERGEKIAADLTRGQYQSVLGSSAYFSHCGVPASMTVNICAAVQNGRAVGVTVSTKPADSGKQSCISSAVRRLGFPSHPRLDVTHTTFAAQ